MKKRRIAVFVIIGIAATALSIWLHHLMLSTWLDWYLNR